jgi:diguanylate cyclase (GGDEF)-like protein
MLAGAALNVLGHGFAVAYCLMTWSGPNRPVMLAGYTFGMAVGIVGVRAAIRGPAKAMGYRFSFAMLVSAIVLVALGAHWDGGAGSPVALGFLLPVLFVASSTARLDPLTGALNRRGLTAFAKQLFPCEGTTGPSVLCLDLDGFKAVNDNLGHVAGDELLQWVVAATRGVLRSADAIARTGGDEFVVVLVDADTTTAEALADRIGRAVRERTGVSIGWACAPHDGNTLAALVQAADQHLYQRKQQRRSVGDH